MSNFIYDDEMLNEALQILKDNIRNDLADYIQYLADTLLRYDEECDSSDEDESYSTEEEEYGEEDIGKTDDGFFYLK